MVLFLLGDCNKKMPFEVIPLDNDGLGTNPSTMPRVPCRISLVSPVRSGKSTCCIRLLTSPDALKGQFSEIWVFSPTAHLDKKWEQIKNVPILKKRTPTKQTKVAHESRDLCVHDSNFVSEVDDMPAALQRLYTKQDSKNKKYEEDPYQIDQICIVIDDCSATSFLRSKKLEQYVAKSRHMKTTFIFSVQTFKSLTPLQRLNTGYFILFEIWDNKELERVYESAGMQYTLPEFKEICSDTWARKDFSAVIINMQNPLKWRFIDNFTHFIVRK
jgi:A32 protein